MAFIKPSNLALTVSLGQPDYMVVDLPFHGEMPEVEGSYMKDEIGLLSLRPHRTVEMAMDARRRGEYIGFDVRLPSMEVQQNALRIRRLCSLCGQKGEAINRKLKAANKKLFCEGIHWENLTLLEKTVNGLEFMASKSLLIDYIKNSNLYKDITTKEFRRGLDDFIICRNIFTHGKLVIGPMPENALFIEHSDNHSKDIAFMPVDSNLIRECISFHDEIEAFINNFLDLIRKTPIPKIVTKGVKCDIKSDKIKKV